MKRNDIIFLLGSAFFLVIAWIAFSVIHTSLTSTISTTLNQQITPIKPTFDDKTINALKERNQVTPNYTISLPSGTPTPTLVPNIFLPIGSASATQASSGGGTTP